MAACIPWLTDLGAVDQPGPGLTCLRQNYESDEAFECEKAILGDPGIERTVQAIGPGAVMAIEKFLVNRKAKKMLLLKPDGRRSATVVKLLLYGDDQAIALRRSEAAYRELAMGIRASRTGHPHVCHVVPVRYMFRASVGIEMEHLPMGDMSQIPAGYTLEQRLVLLRDAADGVAHMHAEGLVHVDIKDSNFCLYGDAAGRARAKVVDFGAARAMGSLTRQDACNNDTLLFRCPELWREPFEQVKTVALDWRTDAWAFGVTTLLILTPHVRQVPWSVAKVTDVHFLAFKRANKGAGPSASPPAMVFARSAYNGLPAFVNFICYNLLAVTPDERFSMERVRDEIAAHLNQGVGI